MVKRRIIVVLAFCGVSLFCSPISGDGLEKTDAQTPAPGPLQTKLGIGTPNVDAQQDAMQKEAALSEILQIRQRLGGSVLEGSSLNDVKGDPSNGFDSSVRAHLGLPAVPVSPDSSLGPASSQSSKSPRTQRMSALEMVASLRKESRSLSTLANDLEGLRQYAHADALRATATKLRLIARQLDIVPESKRSGASTGILQDAGSVPAVRSAN